MAALWFAREGPDVTKGVPAYEFPIQAIVSKLGGKRNFQFLSPLGKPSPVEVVGKLWSAKNGLRSD